MVFCEDSNEHLVCITAGSFMMHRLERWEIHTIFWLGNLKRRDHFEDLGIGGKIILEFILGK
jgi:hypothetical protein